MDAIRCDSKKCMGCHSCTFACAVEHSQSKDVHKAHLESPQPKGRRFVRVTPKGKNQAMACQHCKKPACVEACPQKVLTKREDGFVYCDVAGCDACWECVEACPFDAVKPGDTAPIRCDMCEERGDGTYACVEACPSGALYVAKKKAAAASSN